jgi:hypothetical protein
VTRKAAPKPTRSSVPGVDFTSYDHMELTERVFPCNRKPPVHYMHLPFAMADGTIDRALLARLSYFQNRPRSPCAAVFIFFLAPTSGVPSELSFFLSSVPFSSTSPAATSSA